MMEVEFSTSSGCFGASERRRETSTTGGVEEEEAFLAYEEAFLAYMEEQERACGHLDGERRLPLRRVNRIRCLV